MKNKKRSKVLLLILLLLGISIGFALLSTTLKINGTAGIKKNTWSVYWDNVGDILKTETTTVNQAAVIDPNDNTLVNFNVLLTVPGDYYEFQVDAVNAGTLNAMLDVVSVVINDDPEEELPSYLKYTVTYADGTELEPKHLLAKADQSTTPSTPTRERYKVRLEYDSNITSDDLADIPEGGEDYDIKVEIPYIQATDEAQDPHAPEVVESPFELGDYFRLIPDTNEYVVPSSLTGWSSSINRIQPQDLTLWRVIDIHDDGTVDAVSEYVSHINEVTFGGTTGYANYINATQVLASKFAKEGYTVDTRLMGYDGQTLTISDTSQINTTSSTPPSTIPTGTPMTGVGQEFDGGVLGDTLYLKDIQLVGNVYKSDTVKYGEDGLIAYAKRLDNNTDEYVKTEYLIASREYIYSPGGEMTDWGPTVETWNFAIRYYDYNNGFLWYSPLYSDSFAPSMPIRPIITLRYGINIQSGAGTINNPYILE
jgi:hypothetical protein